VVSNMRSCPFCQGTGRCAKCSGHGTRVARKGMLRVRRAVSCPACNGSGECDLCHGSGKVQGTPSALKNTR
jgi:DnaJ-class molecular chaperone